MRAGVEDDPLMNYTVINQGMTKTMMKEKKYVAGLYGLTEKMQRARWGYKPGTTEKAAKKALEESIRT